MGRVLIFNSFMLLLAACSNPAPPQQQQTAASTMQCGKDTDCKGNRICSAGQCASPSPSLVVDNEGSTQAVAKPVKAELSPSSAVPVCKAGDGRTKIPVWEPTVNEDSNLSSDPPQKDGQIVYIQLYQEASKTTCNDKELNSFSRPENPKEITDGGLAVNIRGNTQFANGICYFRGYFMNEDVMGMHQGWIETFYGAVAKEKIVLSGKYCLIKAID